MNGGGEGGPPTTGHLPPFGVAEPDAHDINTFPHMHSDKDLLLLLPILSAPPLADNVDDWNPEEKQEYIGISGRKRSGKIGMDGRRLG